MVSYCCCCNYAIVGHISMQVFNFVVLSVNIPPHNVVTRYISKTHWLIASLNVGELKLELYSRDKSR